MRRGGVLDGAPTKRYVQNRIVRWSFNGDMSDGCERWPSGRPGAPTAVGDSTDVESTAYAEALAMSTPRKPTGVGPETDTVLADIARTSAALRNRALDDLWSDLAERVSLARAGGRTWEELAKALGVSVQVVRERFDSGTPVQG